MANLVIIITFTTINVLLQDIGTLAARVATQNGVIEGFSDVIDDVTVDIFLGVPFAVPPVGDLRFRAPRPVENWSGVYQATQQPNSCMQLPDTMFDRFSGVEMWNANTNVSEDCLYLNLYVPRTFNKSLPTMIWIFGGSYVYGSITLDIYDGRFLAASQNVIVASMQFRLSVMGFLYSGSDDAPGNMGLLDQQLAIKWIFNNIESFGGDPARITLFGESSGSASVSHHLFARTSWDYFTNAIMLSATSLAPWATVSRSASLAKTKSFAKLMNCDNVDMSEIVKCLRQYSAMELDLKQWELKNGNIGTFSPTVDGYFFQQDINQLIDSGSFKQTDILLGNTKDEGEFFLVYFYTDIYLPENIDNPVPLNRTQFVDIACRIAGCDKDAEHDVIRDALLYAYEESSLPNLRGSYTDILDDILGDHLFKCSVRSLAAAYSQKSDVRTYVYSFEYRHDGVTWPDWMGTLHGYEIELMFGQPFNPDAKFTYSDHDRNVSSKIMEYISTFAHKGNLDSFSSEWPQYTTGGEEHIVFNQDGSTHVRSGFRTKECSFWDYLAPKLKNINSSSENETPMSGM